MRKLNIPRFRDFQFTSAVNLLFDDGQIVSIQIEICYFDHSMMNVTVNIHARETNKLNLFYLYYFI